MSELGIVGQTPRSEPISVRVTPSAKKYIEHLADKFGITQSDAVAQIIDNHKKESGDSNKGKRKRGN